MFREVLTADCIDPYTRTHARSRDPPPDRRDRGPADPRARLRRHRSGPDPRRQRHRQQQPYHFFRSKEELLEAVLDRYLERLDEEIVGPSRAATADPIERVFRILDFYRVLLTATGCRLGCPIGNLAGEVSDTHPRLRTKLAELFAAWRRAVESCLRDAEPHLRPGVDPEEVAVFVLAVMEGGVMQARVERSLRQFEISVAPLRDYLRSLTTETSAQEAIR